MGATRCGGDDESYLFLLFVFTGNDTPHQHHHHTSSATLHFLKFEIFQIWNSPLGILGALESLSLPFTFLPGAAGSEGPGD